MAKRFVDEFLNFDKSMPNTVIDAAGIVILLTAMWSLVSLEKNIWNEVSTLT